MTQRLLLFLYHAGRWRIRPRALIWGAQLAAFVLSGLLAFLLRFEFKVPAHMMTSLQYAIPIWVLVKALVFRLYRLDRGWWIHVSLPDVIRIGKGNLLASAASALVILAVAPSGFPRSIYLLDLLVCLHVTLALRLPIRMIGEAVAQSRRGETKRVLIYGAGKAGVMLLREIRMNPQLKYEVLGFIDDNPRKQGMMVQGVPVLSGGSGLVESVARRRIEEVLIAMPSASGSKLSRILELCHTAGVRYKTIPGLGEIIQGAGLATGIREVAVEDLLSRTPVRLEEDEIRASLEGRVVLVTGAAGSIGSELCRQIARFEPHAIIGLDAAETALFHIDGEMREIFPNIRFHAEIGNIQNRQRLAEVFAKHRPSVVYHAAAYKHVPVMEAHPFEAVENNVFGTLNVARVSSDYGVEEFVMISSDKAVHPTNIMGVTKRVAELLIRSLQSRTKYVSVRFGNVLGSNGSVVPLFKKQIAAGGPVTVTHPDMRRFFMTIPEAVQLVLQAATMGRGREIFVLDMGEPVRIADLARNLILLSGLRPDKDIPIVYTGIRPGEKLYEELSTLEEDTLPTYHEKIKIFAGNGLPDQMPARIEALKALCAARDTAGLVLELKEMVPDYNPSAHLLRRLMTAGARTELAAA